MEPSIPLTEAELRSLVRDAIARARADRPVASGATPLPPFAPSAPALPSASTADTPIAVHVYASHAQFVLGPGGDADGNCIIEPAVRCTHCGFCQSLGH